MGLPRCESNKDGPPPLEDGPLFGLHCSEFTVQSLRQRSRWCSTSTLDGHCTRIAQRASRVHRGRQASGPRPQGSNEAEATHSELTSLRPTCLATRFARMFFHLSMRTSYSDRAACHPGSPACGPRAGVSKGQRAGTSKPTALLPTRVSTLLGLEFCIGSKCPSYSDRAATPRSGKCPLPAKT